MVVEEIVQKRILLARCHVHHLLVTELPAEYLGICHRPIHGHELDFLVPVEASKSEYASLLFN